MKFVLKINLIWMNSNYFGKNAIIPKIGDKKKIIDIALKNASYDLEHYELLEEKVTNKKNTHKKVFQIY